MILYLIDMRKLPEIFSKLWDGILNDPAVFFLILALVFILLFLVGKFVFWIWTVKRFTKRNK